MSLLDDGSEEDESDTETSSVSDMNSLMAAKGQDKVFRGPPAQARAMDVAKRRSGLMIAQLIFVILVLGAIVVYASLQTIDSKPPPSLVTIGKEPMPYMASFTLTQTPHGTSSTSNNPPTLARSHISYDSRPLHERIRIDFYGNDETEHAILIDLQNCTVYDMDWFMYSAMECRVSPLFGFTDPMQCQDWTRGLPRMPLAVRQREVLDVHNQIVERLEVDSNTVLIRDRVTHVPLSFERQDKIFTVTDFVPSFTPNWNAVVDFCRHRKTHGIIAPEGKRIRLQQSMAVATDELARTWARMAMESRCPGAIQQEDIQIVFEAMDHPFNYGYWCGTRQSNLTHPKPPNAAVKRLCNDTDRVGPLCLDGGMDAICRTSAFSVHNRYHEPFYVGSCMVQHVMMQQLKTANLCGKSHDPLLCEKTKRVAAAIGKCWPCDLRETHNVIVPDVHLGYLSPVLASIERFNQYAFSRPQSLPLDLNRTLHDPLEYVQV